MKCYLRIGSDPLDAAVKCDSMGLAVREFGRQAWGLARFGQELAASIHVLDERAHDEPRCNEYPDYVLSLGPRGGIVKERA